MKPKFLLPVAFAMFIGVSGCATPRIDTPTPSQSRLGDDLQAYKAPAKPPETAEKAQELPKEPAGALDLRKALALALMGNPRLKAFAWDIRAKEARALQAGLLPNPVISVEIENVLGTGAYRGSEAAETTLQLSQLIELGGKRAKRFRVAELERNLSGWNYETARIETLTKVAKAFVDVLAAQEHVTLSKGLVGLAKQAFTTASERVSAGKAPPIDETRAKVEYSVSRIRLDKAKRRLLASRKRLATLWGAENPTFEKAAGHLDVIRPIPSAQDVESFIPNNPDIARWETEIKRYKAAVDLEKAGRIPDLTINGGARTLSETGDSAYVLGVSAPLMVFNRNQGAYEEARFNLAQAMEKRKAAESSVRAALANAYQALSSAYAEVVALSSDVLPGARVAYETAKEGYKQGKFGYLEVLDAQRVLFEARSGYVDSLSAYHRAVADVERLIGTPLEAARSRAD